MKRTGRREWLALLAGATGGCLRLQADDGAPTAAPTSSPTATETPTEPPLGTEPLATTGPRGDPDIALTGLQLSTDTAAPGEAIELDLTIRNRGGATDELVVLQVFVGERLVKDRSVVGDFDDGRTLTVGFDAPPRRGEFPVYAVVVSPVYERASLDRPLTVQSDAVTIEWGRSFVPADVNEDSTDQRELAFAAVEAVLLDANGGELGAYDIGVPGEEPVFETGAYSTTRFEWLDGEPTGRFLGPDRTTMLFPEVAIENAATFVWRGTVPGPLETQPTTVQVNGSEVASPVFTPGMETYRIEIG